MAWRRAYAAPAGGCHQTGDDDIHRCALHIDCLDLGHPWIALKLQLGALPIAWSIAWRFALAALVLLGWQALAAQHPAGWRP
jgi:hypothetical protein